MKKHLQFFLFQIPIYFLAFTADKLFQASLFRFSNFLPQEQAQIVASNLISNLCIATELAFVFTSFFFVLSLLEYLLPSVLKKMYSSTLEVLKLCFVVACFLIVLSHIEYMKFFGETVKVSHLHYLLDPTFFKSTLKTLWSPSLAGIILGVSILFAILYRYFRKFDLARREFKFCILLLLMTPLLHASKFIFNKKKTTRTSPLIY